jgi:hypothetical protein
VKRALAAAAGTAAAVCLVVCEVRRRARQARADQNIESLLRGALKADEWTLQAVSLICARLAPDERPLSVKVTARAADGALRTYTARPGDSGPALSVRRGT